MEACTSKNWNLSTNLEGIQFMDTRKLVPGIYLTELLQDGKRVKVGKFIVQ